MAQRHDEFALSFGTAAAEYDRLRSGPPSEAVDWMVGNGVCNAVELGAGTGHFSRRLVEKVPELYAVEPDELMRRQFTANCPTVTVMDGSAEHIPVDDDSVDAVFSTDSWHWFDPAKAASEIARVLRPGGRLAVLWNMQDAQTDWVRDFFAVLHTAHAPDRRPGAFTLPADAGFDLPERHVVEWSRQISRSDLVALLGTYSAVLAMSESDRSRLYDTSHEYLDKHPHLSGRDVIELPLRTVLWRTTLTAA